MAFYFLASEMMKSENRAVFGPPTIKDFLIGYGLVLATFFLPLIIVLVEHYFEAHH